MVKVYASDISKKSFSGKKDKLKDLMISILVEMTLLTSYSRANSNSRVSNLNKICEFQKGY